MPPGRRSVWAGACVPTYSRGTPGARPRPHRPGCGREDGDGPWRTRSGARTYGWILAVGYRLTFVYGLVVANDPDADLLNINDADNVLHLVSALAGLAIALWPDRERRRDAAPPRV